MSTHFAVCAVKGMEDRFAIIDADLQTLKRHHISNALTEDEIRSELKRRGHTDDDIASLIQTARQSPR